MFRSKTTIITISIPFDVVEEIEEFMYVFGIESRSKAISILIHQGITRMRERQYEKYSEKLPEKYPKFEEEE